MSFDDAGHERAGVAPVEVATFFLDANQQLIVAAQSTHRSPSEETIEVVFDAKKGVIIGLTPLIESEFYRSNEDQESVNVVVGAVMGATERLWETATELRPDSPTLMTFDKSVRPIVIGSLTGYLDEDTYPVHAAISLLSSTYEEAVENLIEKVMTSDRVVGYQMNIVTAEARRRDFINFAAVGTAAFLGTGLALILSRRKSKNT